MGQTKDHTQWVQSKLFHSDYPIDITGMNEQQIKKANANFLKDKDKDKCKLKVKEDFCH